MKVLIVACATTLLFAACANPMAALQPEVDRFLKSHSDHIQTVALDQKTIRYAWSGDPKKTPLIFVHGSPGSWQGWVHFLLDEELQANFHVLAIDRLGYGGSDPGQSEANLALQARAIMAALSTNQSGKKPILVGHSYGGPVIARAAFDFPDKIFGLIFVASSVAPELEGTKWYQYPATWWPLRHLIPTDLRVCNEEIFGLKSELTEMLPLWSNLKSHVIIIQGEADDLVPPGNADFLRARVHQNLLASEVRVPLLNHFVPWKRPDLIMDAIRKLKALDAATK